MGLTNRLSRMFHVIDLRSGQFGDLPITYKSMGEKVPQILIIYPQIAHNDDV